MCGGFRAESRRREGDLPVGMDCGRAGADRFECGRGGTRPSHSGESSGWDATASEPDIGFFWPYLFFFQRKGVQGSRHVWNEIPAFAGMTCEDRVR